nr:hypothetical protein [Mesorhizobium sp. BR115XR7A]
MKIATYNVNGRLPVLLHWLEMGQADPAIMVLGGKKQDWMPEGCGDAVPALSGIGMG